MRINDIGNNIKIGIQSQNKAQQTKNTTFGAVRIKNLADFPFVTEKHVKFFESFGDSVVLRGEEKAKGLWVVINDATYKMSEPIKTDIDCKDHLDCVQGILEDIIHRIKYPEPKTPQPVFQSPPKRDLLERMADADDKGYKLW